MIPTAQAVSPAEEVVKGSSGHEGSRVIGIVHIAVYLKRKFGTITGLNMTKSDRKTELTLLIPEGKVEGIRNQK